jgi:peptidoglycan DL-endopeptidase RipA
MTTRLIGLVAGASVGLLLLVITLVGGGTLVPVTPPPGGCAITGPAAPTGPTQTTDTLHADQLAAARTIAAVGTGLGVAPRGIQLALAVARQDSDLDTGAIHGRAMGLFQQQGAPYAGIDRTDPAAASAAFYRQLVDRVPHYADPAAVAFGDAAVAVQGPGVDAATYGRWAPWATALADHLLIGPHAPSTTPASSQTSPAPEAVPSTSAGSTTFTAARAPATVVCRAGGGAGPVLVSTTGLTVDLPAAAGATGRLTFPNPTAATMAAAALSHLGTPYAWGGGTLNGPSLGIRDGGIADSLGDYATIGFDCSGLTRYAAAQAGITLPRVARAQQRTGHSVPWTVAQPGDLLFWGTPAHHVALYLGTVDGRHLMIEAPYSGARVRVTEVRTGGDFSQMAVRVT